MKLKNILYSSLLFLVLQVPTLLWAQNLNQQWILLINEGKQKYAEDSYRTALDKFTQASKLIPTDTTAYLFMLDCGYKTKQGEVVYKAFDNLLFLGYQNPELYRIVISTARDIDHNYAQALQYTMDGLAAFPDNTDLQFEEIKVYYEYTDYANAKSKIKSLRDTLPQHYQALSLLYKIQSKAEQNYADALQTALMGQSYFPDSLVFHENEADAYLRMSKLQAAKNKYEEIITLNPNDPKSYYNIALWYFQSGENKQAIDWCIKAIDKDSMYLDAVYNVGTFYLLTGLGYNKALNQMSIDDYQRQGADFEQKSKEYFELAKPYFERAIAINPGELDAYENLNTTIYLLDNMAQNMAQTNLRASPLQANDIDLSTASFQYADSQAGRLRKGETGYLTLQISNTSTTPITNLQLIISEPLATPGLQYPPESSIDTIAPGDTREIRIPIIYQENNAQTLGISKILGASNKMRLYLNTQEGTLLGTMQEITLELGEIPQFGDETVHTAQTEDIDYFSPKPVSRNFLFIISVNNYLHWSPLYNAVNDATQLRDVLLKNYNFSADYVFELYNEEVVQENIRNELIKIKRELSPHDNLVLYYAGHGYYDTEFDEGSWIPYDAGLGVETDYLSNERLLKYLNALETKHTWVVADACFSGSLFVSGSQAQYEAGNDTLPSRWGFSSGNMERVADGNPGQNSPFASALIQTLSQKHTHISVTEIVDEVSNVVKKSTAATTGQTPIGKPLNVAGNKGGEYILYGQ